MLIEMYQAPGMRQQQRHKILETLATLGADAEKSVRDDIIEFMKTLLDKESYDTVKKAAFLLNDLGEDCGVKVLTENYDRLIDKNGSAEYYFYRGEIYLQFKKYKEARRDYQEGLRKDKKAGRYGLQKAYLSLARCLAGEGRFKEAERNLKKAQLRDTTQLPKQYPEFEAMAQDDRYKHVFEVGFK